jgi:tryptophan synthase alpha chain
MAYNFAKRLKAIKGKTPWQFILNQWTINPDYFILDPNHFLAGLNIYLNPILALGYGKFCHQAKAAGIDGVLVVDLPPEEGGDFYALAKDAGLEIVLLVSPTTDPARLPVYIKLQPSFIYYISRLSVTGIQEDLPNTLAQELNDLRKSLPNTKIAVGFGISYIEQAKYVSQIADGVIIGSKLVSTLKTSGVDAFEDVTRAFADIIHGGNL